MARRIAVLRRLVHPIKGDDSAGPISVLVVPIRAFLQPIISGLADLEPVRVRTGDILDLTETTNRLAELGFEEEAGGHGASAAAGAAMSAMGRIVPTAGTRWSAASAPAPSSPRA